MRNLSDLPRPVSIALLASFCLLIAIGLGRISLVRTLEMKTLDYRFRLLPDQGVASDEIILVEIDDNSIKHFEPEFGRWPWPRSVHGYFLDFMRRARPQAVIFDILFAERNLADAEGDEYFVEKTRELGNVVHSIYLGDQDNSALADPVPARLLASHTIPSKGSFISFVQAEFPFPGLAEGAAFLGHISNVLDPDGPFRHYLPLASYQGRDIPALALASALQRTGHEVQEIEVEDRMVRAGATEIPLDRNGRLPIWFNGGPGTYKSYSYSHLVYSEFQLAEGIEPGISPRDFENKMVLVGVTASGLHDLFTTPFSGGAGEGSREGPRLGKMAGLEIHANMLDNFLHDRYLIEQSGSVTWALIFCGILLILSVIVYVRLWTGVTVLICSLLAYLLAAEWLFTIRYQTAVALPVFSWVAAIVVGFAHQYWFEGRQKRQIKQVFSRYVSRDVFQRLLDDPSAADLGGSRTEMSVLFSDLRGFTSMSEGRAPEEIVDQLNEYFSAMVEVVFEHRGTIDKFVGDMVMALFSAPLPDPEHADHAVQCALAMQARLVDLNADWERRGLPRLQFGVGINSGEMVAGNVGSQSIRSYTVIGDNVNLGARIESLCKEFQATILISEFTRSRLEGDYPLQELGEVRVKGKQQPVKIFKVEVPGVGT